jgi:amino-acid N-acetyltransferase
VIRDALESDAESIFWLLNPYVEKEILLSRSVAEIIKNINRTVVSEEEGRIIGTASLVFFSATLCEIRALAISAEAQGKGIGRELVIAAENKALQFEAARPVRFFALTYTPDFFLRCGYEVTTKDKFPEKIYEVCNFCLRKDDCKEIAVQRTVI